MNTFQHIFNDHYEEMIYILHPRDAVIENVDKMLNCGDPSFGEAFYACPGCRFLKFVPFRCHSRFCPSCGNKYSIVRTTSMAFKLIHCSHRHCVFTIPEELRHFFLSDRSLLVLLFDAVRSVVLRMFHKINQSQSFTPGFVCVLHTFGRDLKWNPHIHCLVSEGGAGRTITWRKISHFNFSFLRHAFCTALLNLLHKHLGDSFKQCKASVYKNHKDGFYVYAESKDCSPDSVIKYIGRYLGRPVIATSRIDSYDGDTVTFHYNRHEDNVLVTESIPALEFISRLIQHIPERQFKMIRYYGIYARHRQQDQKLYRAIPKEKHKIFLSFNQWRTLILTSFGYDPLTCPCCGCTMEILEVYYSHKSVSLQELYERAMRKYKCRAPAKQNPFTSPSSHAKIKVS
ncbi:IS91 family transposase [Hungatella hathewayi]|uniref:IS91 family transposase n=1 Tax=Hungatella hathewayi TaxID=154046 RepID=A0AAW9WR39_9FIRM|nr:IS91 family transposase [Hungatella hathewayi]